MFKRKNRLGTFLLVLAALAAWAATALDVEVLRKCFGAFLIIVGAMELFGKARE